MTNSIFNSVISVENGSRQPLCTSLHQRSLLIFPSLVLLPWTLCCLFWSLTFVKKDSHPYHLEHSKYIHLHTIDRVSIPVRTWFPFIMVLELLREIHLIMLSLQVFHNRGKTHWGGRINAGNFFQILSHVRVVLIKYYPFVILLDMLNELLLCALSKLPPTPLLAQEDYERRRRQ